MNVPVRHPDLLATELPKGIDPDRVAARKQALIAAGPGSSAVTAELMAIQAEQVQVQHDQLQSGPEGTPDGVNRHPLRAAPAAVPEEAQSGAGEAAS